MSSAATNLSAIPAGTRRRLAATLALFATLLAVISALAATGAKTDAAPVFSVIAFVVAVILALMAWGVLHSVRSDTADRSVDDAIAATITAQGGQLCDCEHEHDPDELHITDACAHDGSGAQCRHDCQTCVLAALRPPT